MGMKKDQDLVDLFRERREIAIESTAEEYGGYLFAISFGILKNHHDVEECVNEALWKAWESIPPHWPASLKGYLGVIVRNLSLDAYRKQHFAKRNGEIQVILEECGQISALEGNPQDYLEHSVLSDAISAYLQGESKEKSYLFLRRYYYGDSISDLAKKRNLSQSKVKMTLLRMRQELKKYLKKEGFDL